MFPTFKCAWKNVTSSPSNCTEMDHLSKALREICNIHRQGKSVWRDVSAWRERRCVGKWKKNKTFSSCPCRVGCRTENINLGLCCWEQERCQKSHILQCVPLQESPLREKPLSVWAEPINFYTHPPQKRKNPESKPATETSTLHLNLQCFYKAYLEKGCMLTIKKLHL